MSDSPAPAKPPDTAPLPVGLGDAKDLGEAVTKIGVSQEIVSVFGIAAGVILLLIPGGQVAGAGILTLGVLGLFAKTDDLAANVNKLVVDFRILFDELQAETEVLLMRSVGEKIAVSRTALRTLIESPNNPNLKDPNGAVLFQSSLIVETLGDLSFYLRPFFLAATYSDPFSGRITPPALPHGTGATIVFDYRLTLPAYLEAIAIRLAILTVLIPDYRESARKELTDTANRLESLYVTIRDGIVPIRAPAVQEILSTKVFDSNNASLIRIEASVWDRAGRPYGSVERYSAVSVVDSYRSDRFLPDASDAFLVSSESPFGTGHENPNPPPLPESQLPSHDAMRPFLLEYAIGLIARSRAVYNLIGLRKLKAAIDQLKDLAGEPRLQTRPDGNWSVREIDNTVANILLDRPSTAAGPTATIILSEILTLLESTLISGLLIGPRSLRGILDRIALQN